MKQVFAAIMLAAAVAAQAQDAPAPASAEEGAGVASIAVQSPQAEPALAEPQEEAQDSGSTRLDDVVVTATKRAKNLREIPASISAQSGEDLERRNAQDAIDIVKTVPGINIAPDPINGARISIRGISTGQLSNPTAGSLFGDTSFTDTYVPRVTLDPNPFDLQSVEVLKGPQGTLFGAAALNGAIRYVPEPPALGSFEGRWFAQYSWVSEGGAEPVYGGVINAPMGEDAAMRIMAFDRRAPGYVDDARSGQEDVNTLRQRGVRNIIDWQPGSWDVKFTYAWQRTASPDIAFADNTDGQLTRDYITQPSPSTNQYSLAELDLRQRYDWGDVISQTAYVRKTSDKILDESRILEPYLPVLALPDHSHSGTWSQELRFTSPDDPSSRWSWVTGLFYSQQRLGFDTGYSLTPPGGGVMPPLLTQLLGGVLPEFDADGRITLLRIVANVVIDEKALFADVTRRLSDDLELGLGARFYMTRSGGIVDRMGVLVAAGGTLSQQLDDAVKEKGINPKVSLLWRATENVSAFGAVSRGFRVGGLQPGFTAVTSRQQAPDKFKSDTLWSFESGLRTQWLDNTLRADITGFYIDWQDAQLLQNSPSLPLPYLNNVGGVTSKGAEASAQWLLPWVTGLKLSANGAYALTETSSPFTAADGSEVPSGTPWPFAPLWQTATTADYTTLFGDWALNTSITHIYMGKTIGDLQNKLPVYDYSQWDLLVGVSNTASTWLPSVSLGINNLTDTRALLSSNRSGVPPLLFREVVYNQPRTITLRLEGRF